jgi:hypothetical protein
MDLNHHRGSLAHESSPLPTLYSQALGTYTVMAPVAERFCGKEDTVSGELGLVSRKPAYLGIFFIVRNNYRVRVIPIPLLSARTAVSNRCMLL